MYAAGRAWLSIAVLAFVGAACHAAAPGRTCRRLDLQGEVSSTQEWKAALGEGWVFRVLPIAPAQLGYSGWDLVVDRDPPAGYPDALLLATLPYNSINEREIGTTFGLRAQDALGWNPRSFHFLSNPGEFRVAQQWFRQLTTGRDANRATSQATDANSLAHLLQLQGHASSGQFLIVDAHIVPGVADPQPFAQGWALAASRMRQEIEPALPGQSSPLGRLVWIRFELTLWLPERWNGPAQWHAVRDRCPE